MNESRTALAVARDSSIVLEDRCERVQGDQIELVRKSRSRFVYVTGWLVNL